MKLKTYKLSFVIADPDDDRCETVTIRAVSDMQATLKAEDTRPSGIQQRDINAWELSDAKGLVAMSCGRR